MTDPASKLAAAMDNPALGLSDLKDYFRGLSSDDADRAFKIWKELRALDITFQVNVEGRCYDDLFQALERDADKFGDLARLCGLYVDEPQDDDDEKQDSLVLIGEAIGAGDWEAAKAAIEATLRGGELHIFRSAIQRGRQSRAGGER
jgi:hypothetical protein